MAQAKNKKDLGYLGESFQYRLAHEFITNHTFFEDLSPIIDQNMFTDPNLKTFVGVLRNYYEKEGCVPSFDMMGIELNSVSHSEREAETYASVLDKVINTPVDGADRIREKAEKFFRQQNIIKTANEILKIAGDGDTEKYEMCVNLLNDAMTKGTHNDFGEGVFDHLSETLSDDYRTPIPTGIEGIDKVLEGGLGKGELGVIIGSSSFGKTSMTTAIASHAALSGFKVLQIVFEDRIKQIQRKHIGRLTGVEAKDLSKPENIDFVREKLDESADKEKIQENLRIVKFPSGEKTARQIGTFIKRLSNSGFKPDLVIVDYFECLAHENDRSSSSDWEKEGRTMRKFEAMVGELNIAMWIPTQGTKDSVNAEVVTMEKGGGSFKKMQIAHIIMSIARTIEDIKDNKATIAILKNRAGASGAIFHDVNFNNGTCTISTEGSDVTDGMYEEKEKREKDKLELVKQLMENAKE